MVSYFNLEMIIAIGYRVRSHRGTQFRRWATERLHEYLVKGFAMDDERLKEGKTSVLITLMNSLSVSGTSVHLKSGFIKKSKKFILSPSIMIPRLLRQENSFRSFRIRFTSPYQGILQQN